MTEPTSEKHTTWKYYDTITHNVMVHNNEQFNGKIYIPFRITVRTAKSNFEKTVIGETY